MPLKLLHHHATPEWWRPPYALVRPAGADGVDEFRHGRTTATPSRRHLHRLLVHQVDWNLHRLAEFPSLEAILQKPKRLRSTVNKGRKQYTKKEFRSASCSGRTPMLYMLNQPNRSISISCVGPRTPSCLQVGLPIVLAGIGRGLGGLGTLVWHRRTIYTLGVQDYFWSGL